MKFDFSKIINAFFLSCAAAGISYLCFLKYYEKELNFCEDYPQLIMTNSDVEKYYYKSIDKESIQYDMINGLFDGLDNRYTDYISLKEVELHSVNDSVMLKSNGFQIGKDDKTKGIIITNVVSDSIAERMGMSAGDLIISINDTVVQREGFYNSIELLLAKDKKPLELVCKHNGDMYTVHLQREAKLKDESIITTQLYDNGVLYYSLNGFDINTIPNFEYEMEKYANDIKGMIIDLRKCGGGETEVAVDLFDEFYGSGCQVKLVYEKSGNEELYKTSDGVKYTFPVVLLVSGDTLSSAEILMAFFQDTGRGTAVGTATGGKGIFQRIYTLDNYSEYYLVAGYYYVNDLPNYDGVGITPDIIIDMDPELIGTDDDIQLKKAIELLS